MQASGKDCNGDRPDYLPQLPSQLPERDILEGPQRAVALEPVQSEDELIDSLIGLPWEFIINKDARQEWARMGNKFRSDRPSFDHVLTVTVAFTISATPTAFLTAVFSTMLETSWPARKPQHHLC